MVTLNRPIDIIGNWDSREQDTLSPISFHLIRMPSHDDTCVGAAAMKFQK